MWELEFITNRVDKECLTNIYLSFRNNKRPFKPILAFTDNGDTCNLSVACSQEYSTALLSYSKEVVSKQIVLYYKRKYFENKISGVFDNDLRKVVLDAIINFDIEDDVILCQACFNDFHFLHIDSFYYFQLVPLKEKWQQLYNIIADVLCIGLSYEGYLELLRFLVSMGANSNNIVEIRCDKDKVFITDNSKTIECEPIDYVILGKLINLSPKFINVYSSNYLDNNIIKSISYIWSKKVNFLV